LYFSNLFKVFFVMQRITLRELHSKLHDPETTEAELKLYLVPDPDASRPFDPAMKPNPELVEIPEDTGGDKTRSAWSFELGKNVTNRAARLFRQRIFRNVRPDDARPLLVSEGDSWFQFPLLLQDVIDQLTVDYRIWSLGAAGDTLQNMIFDRPEYLEALDLHGDRFRAFLFSGGGNDIVGEDSEGKSILEQILQPFEPGRDVDWYVEHDRFHDQLGTIRRAYEHMLKQVGKNHPGKPVFLHGYARAIPGGAPDDPRKSTLTANNAFVGRYLSGAVLGITEPQLQQKIVGGMIDRLNEMQKNLCAQINAKADKPYAFHVDVRDTIGGIDDWYDELHPTDAGFSRVASAFRKALGEVIGAG
jgi:hypothetical protein